MVVLKVASLIGLTVVKPAHLHPGNQIVSDLLLVPLSLYLLVVKDTLNILFRLSQPATTRGIL